jgi:uncharacterized membrane protein required for colicin V production
MDTLDVILLLACVAFGISGYRQGFLIGVMSFAGFLGGGALGAHYAPVLHRHVHLGLGTALFGLLVVIIAAGIGQLVTASIGVALRRRINWTPARTLDSFAGALVSVASLLLVAWLIGTALANSGGTDLTRQVRRSAVLGVVDDVVPASAQTWFSSFRRLLDTDGLPEVFGGIGTEHVNSVPPPDETRPPPIGAAGAALDHPGDGSRPLVLAAAGGQRLRHLDRSCADQRPCRRRGDAAHRADR